MKKQKVFVPVNIYNDELIPSEKLRLVIGNLVVSFDKTKVMYEDSRNNPQVHVREREGYFMTTEEMQDMFTREEVVNKLIQALTGIGSKDNPITAEMNTITKTITFNNVSKWIEESLNKK